MNDSVLTSAVDKVVLFNGKMNSSAVVEEIFRSFTEVLCYK